MQTADRDLTPQPVQINRRQAVAGAVALPAIAVAGPVGAAVVGEGDPPPAAGGAS